MEDMQSRDNNVIANVLKVSLNTERLDVMQSYIVDFMRCTGDDEGRNPQLAEMISTARQLDMETRFLEREAQCDKFGKSAIVVPRGSCAPAEIQQMMISCRPFEVVHMYSTNRTSSRPRGLVLTTDSMHKAENEGGHNPEPGSQDVTQVTFTCAY
jgi:hypothetical protein